MLRVITIGPLASVINRCSSILNSENETENLTLQKNHEIINHYSKSYNEKGFTVIGMAYKDIREFTFDTKDRNSLESSLVLTGYLIFSNYVDEDSKMIS